MSIIIDPEFKSLIPPLSESERDGLEKSCAEEGIRDALVVWYPHNILIDGHNRYEIAEAYNLEFQVIEMDFDTRQDVIIWMIRNQQGRRNLTDGVRYELALRLKEALLEKGKQRMSLAGQSYSPGEGLSTMNKPSNEHNTREHLSNHLGWSETKVARADKVWKDGDEEIKEQVKTGELSINAAYNEVRRQKRLEEIERQREEIATLPEQSWNGLYDLISVDPPWPYGTGYDAGGRRVANPYPEMSLEEIRDIELPAKDNSMIFLWTTHQFLRDAFWLLEEWGYTYKATMVWDKDKMGMGRWLRMQCEFCLFAVKGRPFWGSMAVRDIIREPRREHSRKPDAFFELCNKITPGRKLEYFSREQREGWDTFGNDTEKFNHELAG